MSYFNKARFSNLLDAEALIGKAAYIIVSVDNLKYTSSNEDETDGARLKIGFANHPPVWLKYYEFFAGACEAADAIQRDFPHLSLWGEVR